MEVIAHTTMEEATMAVLTPTLMVVMVVMDITSAKDPLMLNQKPKPTQRLGTATDGKADTAMEATETTMEVMEATDMEDTHTAMDIVDTGRLYHQSETTIHYDHKKLI